MCIGIIMDGNRRWAKEHKLLTLEGHRRGMDNVEPIVLAARDFGIQHIVVYAFSTENWNRSTREVSYLINLFEEMLPAYLTRLVKEGVRIRFVGQRERFSSKLQSVMQHAERNTSIEQKITLWICLSYGGRADIVQAAQSLAAEDEEITEESLNHHLWTTNFSGSMPDPDLIIRTGGEHRLSNFLLWQGAYSELFFPQQYWPAFTKEHLKEILKDFARRERRMGK